MKKINGYMFNYSPVLKPNQILNAIQKYHISRQLETPLLQGYNVYALDEESYINTNRLWTRLDDIMQYIHYICILIYTYHKHNAFLF